jgi:hypothetical protein
MPSGWIYDHTDRALYIVQSCQKEKREGDIRLRVTKHSHDGSGI